MPGYKSAWFVVLQFCAIALLPAVAQANDILKAARSGDAEALAAALPADATVDPQTLERPLFFAAQKGHAEVVSLLLDRGADPNTVLDFGSPLHKAARGNHVDVVAHLLKGGADPNLVAGHKDQTALHEAAERGAIGAAGLLLKHGADVNARDIRGLPPIHLAARRGHASMLTLLNETGASPLKVTPVSAEEIAGADKDLGRIAAIECSQCHEMKTGVRAASSHNTGPSLVDLAGRRIGSVDGYAYSDAMKAQAGDWTPDALNRFLADPTGVVPGTSMETLLDLSREERIALVAYLREL